MRVDIPEVRAAECPKSIVLRDARAGELARIADADSLRGMGPVSSFPGWFFDATQIVKRERARDERAQSDALARA